MIRDRISYCAQNLLISKYEHILSYILGYNDFCMRDDVFAVLVLIYDAENEEQYLEKIKRFVAYVKLVAPEIIQLYEASNRIESARGLFGSEYYLHIPLKDLTSIMADLRAVCYEYI